MLLHLSLSSPHLHTMRRGAFEPRGWSVLAARSCWSPSDLRPSPPLWTWTREGDRSDIVGRVESANLVPNRGRADSRQLSELGISRDQPRSGVPRGPPAPASPATVSQYGPMPDVAPGGVRTPLAPGLCAVCGRPLTGRRPQRVCSPRCRIARCGRRAPRRPPPRSPGCTPRTPPCASVWMNSSAWSGHSRAASWRGRQPGDAAARPGSASAGGGRAGERRGSGGTRAPRAPAQARPRPRTPGVWDPRPPPPKNLAPLPKVTWPQGSGRAAQLW
jgi:hypothetical protein